MYSNTGIIQGCYSGQQDRVDELNDRIYARNIPDNSLRPNYDPRPISTKYAIFPVIDRKIPSAISSKQYLGEGGFLPSSINAPTIRNIDTETILRNQTVALQRGIGQGDYVPSSNSDLYKTTVVSRPSEQPFPGLFVDPVVSTGIQPTIANQPIGKSDFFNFTRNQLRNTMIQ